MKNERMLKGKVSLFVIAAVLAAGSAAWADGNDGVVKPLALRTIMRELGEHMQTVTGAISRENWEQVASTAPLIAGHPQPPLSEKIRILGFAGANAGKFKNFDRQTHDAARELEQAAREHDGAAAIEKFAALQTSCLGCHQSFRKAFTEHFYGQK